MSLNVLYAFQQLEPQHLLRYLILSDIIPLLRFRTIFLADSFSSGVAGCGRECASFCVRGATAVADWVLVTGAHCTCGAPLMQTFVSSRVVELRLVRIRHRVAQRPVATRQFHFQPTVQTLQLHRVCLGHIKLGSTSAPACCEPRSRGLTRWTSRTVRRECGQHSASRWRSFWRRTI